MAIVAFLERGGLSPIIPISVMAVAILIHGTFANNLSSRKHRRNDATTLPQLGDNYCRYVQNDDNNQHIKTV